MRLIYATVRWKASLCHSLHLQLLCELGSVDLGVVKGREDLCKGGHDNANGQCLTMCGGTHTSQLMLQP